LNDNFERILKLLFFRAEYNVLWGPLLSQPWIKFFFLTGFGFYYGEPKSTPNTIRPVCRSQVGTKNFLNLELISRLHIWSCYTKFQLQEAIFSCPNKLLLPDISKLTMPGLHSFLNWFSIRNSKTNQKV
jgi:hypothetical protein